MTTLTVLYGPPSDPDRFRRYYEETHVPLAQALPGATDLEYTLEVDTVAGEPVHATFRARFANRTALDEALASPEGQTAQADVSNFADGTVTILVEET